MPKQVLMLVLAVHELQGSKSNLGRSQPDTVAISTKSHGARAARQGLDAVNAVPHGREKAPVGLSVHTFWEAG